MTERRVEHTTFRIERRIGAPPGQVFACWSDLAAKRRWFGEGEGFSEVEHTLDFRVGGLEALSGQEPRKRWFENDTVYHDIVSERRIVFSYRMKIDGSPISVSLSTVELQPSGAGTTLILVEQGAFLDGLDDADERQRGWSWLLDRLAGEAERGGSR